MAHVDQRVLEGAEVLRARPTVPVPIRAGQVGGSGATARAQERQRLRRSQGQFVKLRAASGQGKGSETYTRCS